MSKNSNTNDLDTDIDNYSVDDLLLIFGLNNPTPQELNIVANKMINKMISDDNSEIAIFLQNAKEKLFDELYEVDMEDTMTVTNQYPDKKKPSKPLQTVDRNHRVQFFDNSQQTMKQERLEVADTFDVPVAQGYINPNLKNITTRIVCIDSQFRPNLFSTNATSTINTDFTIDLSDPLLNTISIKLYSIQIPKSWYNIDTGNNCFDISFNGVRTSIFIEPGNYLPDELTTKINGVITDQTIPNLTLSYNSNTQKVSIDNGNDISAAEFIFYSPKGFTNQNCLSCSSNSYENYNLGWTLGFRNIPDSDGNVILTSYPNPNTKADAAIELYGPKYFLLVVDDFNQNHLNKGLINSVELGTKLSLPKYINLDNKTCDPSFNRAVFSKSAPRKFTQAQLYTMNSILDDRKENRNRLIAPTTSDVLALIPIKKTTEDVIVEYGVDLLQNKREYFGPVTIERLRIRLLDDKGNLVNLNKRDWSFSLHVEHLYQY
jgi:hypothetical protein